MNYLLSDHPDIARLVDSVRRIPGGPDKFGNNVARQGYATDAQVKAMRGMVARRDARCRNYASKPTRRRYPAVSDHEDYGGSQAHYYGDHSDIH